MKNKEEILNEWNANKWTSVQKEVEFEVKIDTRDALVRIAEALEESNKETKRANELMFSIAKEE